MVAFISFGKFSTIIYSSIASDPPPPPITFPTYHLIVGGVAGFPGHFGFLLSGFLRVRKEVNLDIGVGIIPILEQLLQRECKAKPSICLCVTIPVVTP